VKKRQGARGKRRAGRRVLGAHGRGGGVGGPEDGALAGAGGPDEGDGGAGGHREGEPGEEGAAGAVPESHVPELQAAPEAGQRDGIRRVPKEG